jgi:tetratricopeptide (TPR) repeat protein
MTLDRQSADILLEKGDTTFQQKKYAEAFALYEEALGAAREEFNRPVEVEALSQMARMKLLLNKTDDAKKYIAEAASRANDSDSMGWSRYLGVKGRVEWKTGDMKTARQTFEAMFDYCSLHDLWSRAVDAAHMVAIVAEAPEDQIEWSRKGIAIAEARETENWLGPLWNNLAGIYFEMKKYDSALESYQTARDFHWRFSDERAKLVADYHVGMTYRFLGKYGDAQSWLRPVLAWAERLQDHDMIGQACEDLGEAAIGLGKKNEGVEYLKRVRDEYKLAGYEKNAPELWESINKRLREAQ